VIDVSSLVPEAREIVRQATQVYEAHTRPWLIGLLIHGSALKGGFIPRCSDIDFRLYLRDEAFAANGDLRWEISLAIQRDLVKIDPAPFQYIQCYAQPPRLNRNEQTGGDMGPIPGSYRMLLGELPVAEPTTEQVVARARRQLDNLNSIPAHLANGFLDHGGGRLERHVRLLCTEVWPTLFNVLTVQTKNPFYIWAMSKDAAMAQLAAGTNLGQTIRSFYRAVVRYFTSASSVENAFQAITAGVEFLQSAKDWVNRLPREEKQ